MRSSVPILISAFITSTAVASVHLESNRPEEIPAPVTRVFVPHGFDDNDNVEIVVYGEFQDSCLRVGDAVADVDAAARRIEVTVTALRYPGTECVPLVAPFLLTARVGLLAQGDYEVYLNRSSERATRFTVATSQRPSADDYLYAPVRSASVELGPDGRQALVLEGRYPPMFIACPVLDRVQTYRNPHDVLVALPILRVDPGPCENVPQTFRIRQALTEPFDAPGLVHIRVLNGASLNLFVDPAQLGGQ